MLSCRAKFRLRNSKLPIERGRYNNIPIVFFSKLNNKYRVNKSSKFKDPNLSRKDI